MFQCLEISEAENPQRKICCGYNPDKTFRVSYTHSVNKGRVKDCFILADNGEIVLDKTIFVSYGAGIPEPEGNEEFVITEEGLEIQNLNRNFKTFRMSVGVEANHALEFNNNVHYLENYFPAKTALILKNKRVSFTQFNMRIK